MERECCVCGQAITACMGFTVARDLVRAFNGEVPYTSVRERCGVCVERTMMALEEGANLYEILNLPPIVNG